MTRHRPTPAARLSGMAVGLVAAPAWAHVHVEADNPVRGDFSVLTFEVPNESDTGAMTTQLSVTLPNVTSASTELMPGWSARLDRDTASGVVRSVTWTAAPGVGITPDRFALFRIDVKLPDTGTTSFPAAQTYSDGTVVHWDQPTSPGGSEPEHPAPTLTLTAGAAAHDEHRPAARPHAAADTAARWLAGAGIAVGVVGIVLALVVRRRA